MSVGFRPRVWGVVFRVFLVSGGLSLGLRVAGLGFRVEGLGLSFEGGRSRAFEGFKIEVRSRIA